MLLDRRGRALATLRLSVTDRCNLRCTYCMPEAHYTWLEKPHLLSFEELTRVVRLLRVQGLEKVRITGGEPLLRQELPKLVGMLAQSGVPQLALTSNGVLLEKQAEALRAAGLQRLTVSLDTLRPEVFSRLAQRSEIASVLSSLRFVRGLGFQELKLDTVVVRGVNDGELVDLVRFAGEIGAEIRFIEYMDVGGATRWEPGLVVSQAEILEKLRAGYGSAQPLAGRGSAPAERFRLSNGQVVGVVASVTRPFCADCDRLRLTADGQLLLCLYARTGLDLRQLLRSGAGDDEVSGRIAEFWMSRQDQGAVDRTRVRRRSGYVSLKELRADPRLEMHTRGG
ncbi:MAG: GTP 3',8-cyclase MoaA [Candidatus Eremiobacteraeota bacterium]|nr:GTP 3',8-cyclase MoaA [Candidatus Eremiobacteraeota bacterium]MCW5870306.1 GTP 3',8-cyclase MoaA [Candidatus Eremiobacteraeota bacterium]